MKNTIYIAALCIPSLGLAEDNKAPAFDQRGAVLCSYAITLMVQNYASKCSDDAQASAWLLNVLDNHRDFVGRNGPASQLELDAFEANNLPDVSEQKLCSDPGTKGFFENIVKNKDSFRAEIAKSLSVDRKPVWNPCL